MRRAGCGSAGADRWDGSRVRRRSPARSCRSASITSSPIRPPRSQSCSKGCARLGSAPSCRRANCRPPSWLWLRAGVGTRRSRGRIRPGLAYALPGLAEARYDPCRCSSSPALPIPERVRRRRGVRPVSRRCSSHSGGRARAGRSATGTRWPPQANRAVVVRLPPSALAARAGPRRHRATRRRSFPTAGWPLHRATGRGAARDRCSAGRSRASAEAVELAERLGAAGSRRRRDGSRAESHSLSVPPTSRPRSRRREQAAGGLGPCALTRLPLQSERHARWRLEVDPSRHIHVHVSLRREPGGRATSWSRPTSLPSPGSLASSTLGTGRLGAGGARAVARRVAKQWSLRLAPTPAGSNH